MINMRNSTVRDCAFWAETQGGDRTYWFHLTRNQARDMWRLTTKSCPTNLKAWGWGPSEDLRWADRPLADK